MVYYLFMDLLEYHAKHLFREIGIPVLPSQTIDRPSDLKTLKIPYPVVLKSQVPKGSRGKVGGIRFVENTIDAIAAAQIIFHLPIMGQYPQVLLAESRYNAEREFYLAVALDYILRRPVLLGSPQGGIDSAAVRAKMQQVIVDGEFSPFYARRLAVKMGLEGKLILSVSAIVEAMYKLFIQKDLDMVEINPLGVSPQGEVMALDGKVIVNDAALGRHPDLALLASNKDREMGMVREAEKLFCW
jgi:succinyl-CoA synthetase beta subunit